MINPYGINVFRHVLYNLNQLNKLRPRRENVESVQITRRTSMPPKRVNSKKIHKPSADQSY